MHFPRMRRHGNPEFITRTPNGTPFWDLVNVTLACWLWLGGKTTAGYGQWRDDSGQAVYAHRWVLNLTGSGLPPDNMHAHHECLNTSCVNPDHLLVLTPKEHRQRHREMRLAVLQQTGSPR